jgi:MFS superfamily sulfate permease-like transporter
LETTVLTYVLFFLIVALATGIFALMAHTALAPIMLLASLAMFVWAGVMYMRARRRRARR